LPGPEGVLNGYAVGIRWPHALRRALEIAASGRGQSVAGYIEAVVLRALIAAGLIEIERRPADDDI
jgi:hypothetical protein